MADHPPRPHERPGTGAEDIPPGATGKAFRRPLNPPTGAPGSGAGPRHAAGDPGDGNELTEPADWHEEDAAPEDRADAGLDATAYAGHAGGAVGGTPAEDRASGGRIHGGLAPGGVHRGDSTVGADPTPPAGEGRKRSPKKKG